MSFKPRPTCEACGLWSSCQHPMQLPRSGNEHLINEPLVYVVIDQPKESTDECANPLDDSKLTVLHRFLEKSPFRWKLIFYVKCAGKEYSSNQSSLCSGYFFPDLLKDKPSLMLALGRKTEDLLLGPSNPKRPINEPYPFEYSGFTVPVIISRSPYQYQRDVKQIVAEYHTTFTAAVQLLKGDFVTVEDEDVPFELVTTEHDAISWVGLMPERVFFDIENTQTKDPGWLTMYHPKTEMICASFGWVDHRGKYKYITVTHEALSSKFWLFFVKDRILEAYNAYHDTLGIWVYYGVNPYKYCKGIGDTFFKFFLADQSNHGNSLKKRAMQHLGCKDWSLGMWEYMKAKTKALREEAKEVKKYNKKAPPEPLPMPDRLNSHFGDPPKELTHQYCANDVDRHMRLELEFKPECNPTVYKLITEGLVALATMAHRGIPIDLEWLDKYHKAVDIQSQRLTEELMKVREVRMVEAGWTDGEGNVFDPAPLNVKSWKFMESIATALNHIPQGKTDSGRMKMGATELKALAGINPQIIEKEHKHKVFSALFRLRKNRDLVSKFIHNFQAYTVDNLVHTTYRLGRTETEGATAGADLSGGTDSGRLSSDNPNVHNIKKDKTLRNCISFAWWIRNNRRFYGIRDPLLVEVDYGTIELVVLAWMAGVKNMTQALLDNIDLHQTTASLVYKIPLLDVTKEQRDIGKTGNFAIVYGEGPNTFAARNGYSLQEALNFFENFHAEYPEISQFFNGVKRKILKKEPITTPFGRSRTFELTGRVGFDGHIYREAGNYPIQGTASDMTLWSLVQLHKLIERPSYHKPGFLPINIVHDAIWFAVEKDRLMESLTTITDIMVDNSTLPFRFDVPRKVGYKIGTTAGNWVEYKTLNDVGIAYG